MLPGNDLAWTHLSGAWQASHLERPGRVRDGLADCPVGRRLCLLCPYRPRKKGVDSHGQFSNFLVQCFGLFKLLGSFNIY